MRALRRDGSMRVSLTRGVTPRYVLDLAVEVMPDAAVVSNDEGEIVLVNRFAEELFGYPAEELLGEYIELLILDDARRRSPRGTRQVDLTRSGLPEPVGRKRDGTRFPIEIGFQTIETENGPHTLTTFRDITERRQVERVKTEFIQNAAHELRTPLAAVAGLVQVLSEHRRTMSDEQMQDTLVALRRQGERARILVNNLLDLTQLEHGRLDMTIERVDVGSMIELALEAHPPPPGIAVEFNGLEDVSVPVDPRRFTQIISNLLSNAYRSDASMIVVECAAMRKQVLVRVEDDGRGVPDELRGTLFEPFSRGLNRGPEGSGLGLALGRALVEAFGGDMWFEPVDPKGARFNLRLPRA